MQDIDVWKPRFVVHLLTPFRLSSVAYRKFYCILGIINGRFTMPGVECSLYFSDYLKAILHEGRRYSDHLR